GTGTLNITQLRAGGVGTTTGTDLKGFTLTLTPGAGGTISISGDMYNSTGVGGIVQNGAGTLTLSGGANNTYTGGTQVITGTLGLGSNTGAGTGTITLGGTSSNTPTLTASGGARTIANNVSISTETTGNATIGGSNSLTINGSLTGGGGSRT